ncbi:MAG TPA: multicopper oxidase family protein [Acidimicrobiales bacterium]|nr:multicopper oxidase family protein [Acidimicrobiales bacterium]
MSRRLFLAGAGVAVGAGLYATFRTIGDRGEVAAGLVPATNRTLESVGGWLQPQTRRSSNGELATTLRVSEGPVPIGTTMVKALTYERMYPGPTLDVEAGDRLVIDLVNAGPKATNLHTHGLHVTPRSPADNVLMALDPGHRYRYEFDIPADHPAGTYWYHAHWGMLTDSQVFGGLFGALVVRGELDQLEGIAGLPERVMVLSQLQTIDGAIVEGDMSPIDQQVTLINGLYQPTVRAGPGETQRWRLVNAGTLFYRLRLDGHPLRVIGIDGNPLTVEEPTDVLQIPPGGRADVLVTADAEGAFAFRSLSWKPLGNFYGTAMVPVPQTVANLQVPSTTTGTPSRRRSTGLLPLDDLRDVPIARRRVFELAEREPRGTGRLDKYEYFINGRKFDPWVVNSIMLLGTVEEWEFVNLTYEPHPVHIHINPFQVVARNGVADYENHYRDTAILPPFGSLTVRTRFTEFVGIFVWHCHILFHEDNGMMQIAEVVPTADMMHNGGPRRLSDREYYALQHGLTGDAAPI